MFPEVLLLEEPIDLEQSKVVSSDVPGSKSLKAAAECKTMPRSGFPKEKWVSTGTGKEASSTGYTVSAGSFSKRWEWRKSGLN